MKAPVLGLLSFLAVPQIAPVPQNVAITEEMHHKLVLENPYVRIFHASVPIHEATLLHRHDLPYVTVSLGNNDFMNAVVGKPETEVVQKDRQIGYSEGGFAHTIRPVSDSSFNNITSCSARKVRQKTAARKSLMDRSAIASRVPIHR